MKKNQPKSHQPWIYQEAINKFEEVKTFGSSGTSTKDRDNSNSNSATSKDDTDHTDSKDSVGMHGASLDSKAIIASKGTVFEDNIENKTYMIKSSGTIVDINRK
jgi:hypothetical protein